ncbi:hypothetical protein J6590_017716 [Homalodisca vitripennis]|nr:hypothetical protein J6590_017716 [Homalodisca vitripennis]
MGYNFDVNNVLHSAWNLLCRHYNELVNRSATVAPPAGQESMSSLNLNLLATKLTFEVATHMTLRYQRGVYDLGKLGKEPHPRAVPRQQVPSQKTPPGMP